MFSWNAVQLFSFLKGSLWIHVLCAEARWISFRVTSPERRLVVKLPSVTATKWLVLLIFSSVGSDCTPQTKNQPFCKPFMRLRFHNLRNPDVYGDAVADVFDKTQAQMQREPPVRQGLLRLFKEIITFFTKQTKQMILVKFFARFCELTCADVQMCSSLAMAKRRWEQLKIFKNIYCICKGVFFGSCFWFEKNMMTCCVVLLPSFSPKNSIKHGKKCWQKT